MTTTLLAVVLDPADLAAVAQLVAREPMWGIRRTRNTPNGFGGYSARIARAVHDAQHANETTA